MESHHQIKLLTAVQEVPHTYKQVPLREHIRKSNLLVSSTKITACRQRLRMLISVFWWGGIPLLEHRHSGGDCCN